MLKFKIKVNANSSTFVDLDYWDLFMSPNGDYISGITSHDYHLIDGQKLYLDYNKSGNFQQVTASIKDAYCQGYVIYNKEYRVTEFNPNKEFDYDDYVPDGGEPLDMSPNLFFRYKDGRFFGEDACYDSTVTDKVFTISGQTYPVVYHPKSNGKTDDENLYVNIPYSSVTVPTKYYVLDGQLMIDDTTYKVDYSNGIPVVTLKNGTKLLVRDYQKNKWKHVLLFKINKEPDYELELDVITCAVPVRYIEYGQYLSPNIYNERYYLQKPLENSDDINAEYVEIDGVIYPAVEDAIYVDINDKPYKVQEEWRNSAYGELLHLYPDSDEYYFSVNQVIHAYSVEPITTVCDVFEGTEQKYIKYCGKKYEVADDDTVDYINVFGVDYQLTKLRYFDDKTKGLYYGTYYENDKAILVKVYQDGDKVKAQWYNYESTDLMQKNAESFDVTQYEYVTINNDKFIVETRESIIPLAVGELQGEVITLDESTKDLYISSSQYVNVTLVEDYILDVENVEGANKLLCRVRGKETEGCAYSISINADKFKFVLENRLFDLYYVSEEAALSEKHDKFPILNIFNAEHYINIPIPVGNEIANNLHMEDLLENQFYATEKANAINRIVDMERDIYVPSFMSDDIDKLLNEIQFHLHFRTRNLNDWSINDDIYSEQRSHGYSGGTQEDYTKINKTNGKITNNLLGEIASQSSWNIFDYYYNDYFNLTNGDDRLTQNIDSYLVNEMGDKVSGYVQPSDLLYFLNFNDDDVFYQKSKIAKSFMRLTFFDSPDPKVQSLLHTSTIFMDENGLYKVYVDNSNEDNIEPLVFQSVTDKTIINNFISVGYEPLVNDERLDERDRLFEFNDDKRIASTFKVQSHYETNTSSEGFYLYLFKDYSTELHERTIYMRIEFNHAGEGKTVNFFVPRDKDNQLISLLSSDKENINSLKEGLPIEEMFSQLYIPIKVKYNTNLKKYTYSFPEEWNKHILDEKNGILHLNLYETKIKDESYVK